MAAATQVVLELTAIDGVTAVVKQVTGTVDKLKISYEQLAGVVKATAALVGAGMFASWIQGSIEALNHMRELTITTGLLAETLSGLKPIAKNAGMDLDAVAGYVQKLTKNMFEFAETGKGKAAQAFERLGYSQEEVRAGMQDMNSFIPEFAQRLLSTGSASEQVAISMSLMNKGGAESLRLWHELAEAQKLQGSVTQEQLEAAHEYMKALNQLESGANKLKIQMASGLLPSLIQILETFIDLKGKQGDATGFFEAFGTAARYAAGAVASVWLVMRDMVDGMAAFAAQAVAIAHLDFEGASAIGAARAEQSAKNEAEYNAMWAKLTGAPNIPGGRRGGSALGGSGGNGGGADPTLAWTPQDEEMFQARRAAYKESDQMRADEARTLAELVKAGEQHEAYLNRETERYKDLLDPMRAVERERQKLQELYDSGKLSETEYQQLQVRLLSDVTDNTKNASSAARDLGITFTSAFEKAIIKGRDLQSVLQGLAQDVLQIYTRKTVTEPLAGMLTAQFGGMLGGGGSQAPDPRVMDSNYLAELAPFAGGGSFTVGGSGGTDSQVMSFRATPGEMVDVRTPGQDAASGGGDTYIIDARGADRSGLATLASKIDNLNGSIEFRAVGAMRKYLAARGSSM